MGAILYNVKGPLYKPIDTFTQNEAGVETMILEPEKFRSFELAGWQGIPNEYHQAFGMLTRQAIEPLLDAVRVKKGMSLLDIASGPGYVAAAAAQRGATVLGVDFSAAMVAQAQALHHGVEFREGDAEHLPLGNGLFDAAVMNFGILHLGQPEQALAEAYRVLRTGGRFAFSVWAKPVDTIGFGIVLRAVELHGEPRVELPEGPPFFFYSDPEECERGLIVAGFESPSVTKLAQVWRLPAGDGLFNAMRDSTVRTAGLLRAQKPTVLNKIRDEIRAALAKYTKGDVVELPMPAWIACGVKSAA
jgi:SAM-dependent methyltransferase